MRPPALVAISHGTDSVAGRAAVGALVAAVRRHRPSARGGFVDVLHPDVATVLRKLPPGRPAVIVPLLLSAGYHVRVDLARAAGEADRAVRIAPALGPDDGLVRLLVRRLGEAGLQPDDAVVLAAAGSSDPSAVADCHDTGRRLAALLRRPVTVGFVSAAEPRLAEAVAAGRGAGPRVVVATYLLAPGYFSTIVQACGADVVSAPLLAGSGEPPEELLRVVLDRFDALREVIRTAPRSAPLTAAAAV